MFDRQEVFPGKSMQLKTDHFTKEENEILNKLSEEWYITNGGYEFNLGVSSYKHFLMKPTDTYRQLFNIEREIIVVFSNYKKFEARSLDTFEFILNKSKHRIERICFVLISKDIDIEQKITDLLKRDAENQIIIPFYFEQLINENNYYIRNHFKKHFYNRDLFAFLSPLKKDIYFFGRTDLIHKIVNRHKSNENSGLFGLRKTGKTSLIFGIQRVIKKQEGFSVFIDCQNTAFHKRRWNKSLYYVISEIKNQNNIKTVIHDESEYTEENASLWFEKDLKKIQKKIKLKNVFIIFDEIERITYELSPTEHWREGLDFIYFWQTLRSIFQKNDNLFSYLIVGTNPKCIETAIIKGQDNPISSQIPYEYIPPFSIDQTKDMVKTLGLIMGLQFDETLYSKLTDDFGGHPFLIRIVCSIINKKSEFDRPIRIDNYLYEKAKLIFNNEHTNYIEMILSILQEYYSDEYEMLKFLAIGDTKLFNEYANELKNLTNHLLGYEIIDKNRDRYSFKISAIKKYLIEANKYEQINLSNKDRLKEISERRNIFEPKLRKIVKQTLQRREGSSAAKNKVLDIMGGKRKLKYSSFSYEDIFNPNIAEIYLEDLRKIIITNWNYFEFIFERNLEKFKSNIEALNKYRNDAHAKKIAKDEFAYFRVCISQLEIQIDANL